MIKKSNLVYERKPTQTNQKLNTLTVISHKGLKIFRLFLPILKVKQFIKTHQPRSIYKPQIYYKVVS